MYRIAILIILLIVHGSLYPWRFRAPVHAVHPFSTLAHAWQPIVGRQMILDAAGNIAFYIPLGVVLFAALARRHRAGWSAAITVLSAAVLSASVEITQLFTPTRNTSASDFLFNVAGAAIGVAAAAGLRGHLRPAALHRGIGGVGITPLLLACWTGWQLFPVMPETGRLALLAKAAALFHPGRFDWPEAGVAAAEWLAIYRLVKLAAGPRQASRVFMVLLAVLAVKLLMVGRTVTWPEIAGAAAALVLRRFPTGRWYAPVLLLGAVIARGLEPFRFSSSAQPFHWVPFEAFIAGNWQLGAAMLLRKIFWYGGIVWLARTAGVRLRGAAGGLGAVLAAIETAQIYIPGHVAESTDPVLAVLAGLLFYWMGRERPRQETAEPPLPAAAPRIEV